MGKEVHCYSVPDYASAALAAAVEDIFAQSAAARALGPRSRVLVKPNLVAKHAPEKAVTTHPAVLDAVCAALRRRGVESITVADSPGGLYNPAVMKSIYKASGLLAVCERHGALAYTACEAAPRKTDGVRVKEFSLLRPVLEADFIIDLPKVKTHVMTGMSCAVKNLFGTVPGLQKAEFHMRFPEKEPFGEMLVDLCETVRPQLIIADGVLAMEGDGPAGGTPRALGLVLGGEDAYAVDLAVCRLMGMPAMRVPYLAAAHARGLCEAALEEALLRGDTVGLRSAFPVDGLLPAHINTKTAAESGFVIGFDTEVQPFPHTLHLVPRVISLGIGCRKGVSAGAVEQTVREALGRAGLPLTAVNAVASIDIKKEEPGLVSFCAAHGLPFAVYSAEELNAAPGEFTASAFVKSTVGVDSVCERAAVVNAGNGTIIARKYAKNGVTAALAAGGYRVCLEE